MRNLWHRWRQSDKITALSSLLAARENELTTAERNARLLVARLDAATAQLNASRALHDRAIGQLLAAQADNERMADEIIKCRKARTRERSAIRSWITRHTEPRIWEN